MSSRFLVLLLGVSTAFAAGAKPDVPAIVAELGRRADIFERNAYRIQCVETFRQTVPKGARIGRNRHGVEVVLPGFTREIVSRYGFVPEDVRGGSLREVRMVLSVDGLQWNRGRQGLESVARELASQDERSKRKMLETWEEYGLSGFITDLGQLVLLFARGNTKNYDFGFDRQEGEGADTLWVFRFEQRAGDQSLTIHGEGKKALHERLHGTVWVRADDQLPVRIVLESERKDTKGTLKDAASVSYFETPYGTLMPVKIVHQQFGDDTLLVTNEFTYSDFKQTLPRPRSR